MKPIRFPQTNTIFGVGQKGVNELPAYRAPNGDVYTLWELTEEEIKTLLETKKIWCCQITGGRRVQPQLLKVAEPEQKPISDGTTTSY